jgi:phosphatidate cytidylyltransferase
LKQRVLTAALLIPPVLLAVFLYNPFPFWILAVVAITIANAELCRLTGEKTIPPILGYLLLAATLIACRYSTRGHYGEPDTVSLSFLTTGLVLLAGIGAIAGTAIARGRRGSLVTLLAGLWIAAPLTALALLKYPFGDIVPTLDWSTPVLLAIVPLWVGDTLAIFIGKPFGKHLLAPKISPKKSVEGAVANLIGCVGGAIGIGCLTGASILVSVCSGFAAGTLGQAGDLLESAMKRSAGVKDSGNLLPGHGGLLDRIDSILLSAPVVALIVVTLGSVSG